ncbi:MAG: cell division protein FtsA [Chloroflexota bacterium]
MQVIVGIDIGTTKICTVVGELDDHNDLRIVGVGIAPSRGMRKGVVVDVAEAGTAVSESIAKAERTSGYKITRAHVSLAGEHIASVNSTGVVAIGGDQGIAAEDVDRALDSARAVSIPHGREIIHIIPRGFTVDGQDGVRNPLGMHAFRLEVEAHIVTASLTSLLNLSKCVQGAGVQADELVLNSIASAESVLTATEKEMGVIVADIGGGTTDLAIYIEGMIWHTKVIPVGGSHVTNDVAVGLRLPFNAAERAKIEHGHAQVIDVDQSETFDLQPFGDGGAVRISRKDLTGVVEARMAEIMTLIMQEAKRSGYDGLLSAGLVMCGGAAQLPGLSSLAQEITDMPVRVAQPMNLYGLVDAIRSPAYATSVGLLRWGLQEHAPLKPRRTAGQWGKRITHFIRALFPDSSER